MVGDHFALYTEMCTKKVPYLYLDVERDQESPNIKDKKVLKMKFDQNLKLLGTNVYVCEIQHSRLYGIFLSM